MIFNLVVSTAIGVFISVGALMAIYRYNKLVTDVAELKARVRALEE